LDRTLAQIGPQLLTVLLPRRIAALNFPSMRAIPILLAIAATALPAAASPPGEPPMASAVVVEKQARRLTVFDEHGRAMRTISGIQLGDAPQGHKRFQGDERTPEGRYTIDWGNPESSYHLSLHISYPNAADQAYAAALGRNAGGMIMIHGQPTGMPGRMRGDWTDGCIALANDEIEYLWQAVPDGTTIDILP
jgi:murein L,D-transpeptidase YafK